jgi:hypothetical protein
MFNYWGYTRFGSHSFRGVRSCEAIASETVAVDGFAAVGGSGLEIEPVFQENAVRIG